ncbi:autotransporter outer membrane beta-barrel domain-containing protein [Gilliamella intestini]|uniref:Outer membrane protein IcsA n=1 Tax=Gilliamella intestini TaxID=1798183 RepID=A0A1C4BPN3_9GAMM|nr:autotransporter outer membrane beta-barrel domain-containing protein [Gilliamella intestini]SCC08835.1 outer membrane protein IcsA [Gilliamella intestini]
MNHIYRLIWDALRQSWVVVSELTCAHKKTTIKIAAITLGSLFLSSGAFAETQNITLPADGSKYQLEPIDGLNGTDGTSKSTKNGTDGKAAYIFETGAETKPEDNVITIDSDVFISGGNGGKGFSGEQVSDEDSYTGGNGGNGALAIKGDRLKIINDGTINGGEGGRAGFGSYSDNDNDNDNDYNGNSGDAGDGGGAISGNYLVITNSGEINGGGASYTITAGLEVGKSGNGGVAIFGDNQIIENDGYIRGGYAYYGHNNAQQGIGSNGGEGGTAILGNHKKITNRGKIAGMHGGSGVNVMSPIYEGFGGNGGNGGDAIKGDDLKIDNYGYIVGGFGGEGGMGYYYDTDTETETYNPGKGGDGGMAISGDNLNIKNYKNARIEGGGGGRGGYGGMGDSSGRAGHAINSNHSTIANDGIIQGGSLHYAAYTNEDHGGYGINGDYLTITNGHNGEIYGGSGLGQAGIAINSNHTSIINEGQIIGGDGYGYDASSASGGHAINGSYLTITNTNSAIIQGGRVEVEEGIAGIAINGDNLNIRNQGSIICGDSSNNDCGTAIYFTGGQNNLTLQDGSDIQGDIVLASGSDNTLQITSEAQTTVDGSFEIGSNTSVTLSGQKLSFSKNANFGSGTTLTFTEGASLHADSITFNNTKIKTNITNWMQTDILLVSSINGINGNYEYSITNDLLTEGAKDYAGLYLNNGNRDLVYGLKWNDFSGDGYGTFDLKSGAIFNLKVSLTDNTSNINNINGWDGKSLTKEGLGTLILSAKNSYSGATNINNGTLKLDIDNAIANTTDVTIAEEGTLNLGGHDQKIAHIYNQGKMLINDFDANVLDNAVTVTGDMYNKGTLILNNCQNCAGQTYVQQGNWIGEGGTVQFGTVLADDASITDRLKITGSATGTTKVKVINEGGHGAHTIEGIELISTGSSTENAFQQDGRIIAGSYEYHLQQGDNFGNNMNKWYLTSEINYSGSEKDANIGNTPNSSNKKIRVFRPEAGSYVNNLAAANNLFTMRLQDRQDHIGQANLSNDGNKHNSVWARITQGHSKNTTSDKQLKTTANRTVFQLGGDVLTNSFFIQDELHIGLTGGYGKQNSTTRSHISKYRSDGKVEGYNIGLYGTWYQNIQEREGAYADSWILYNWFNNRVQGEQLANEKYHSHGFTASLELGYEYKIASFFTDGDMFNDIYIRPQAQVMWLDVKANDHTENNGTRVYGEGDGNIQTRLGMRISLNRHNQNIKSGTQIEPFAEFNWLHNTKNYAVNMTDATTNIQGTKNVAEAKIGIEGRIKDNLYLSGNISQQFGEHAQRDTQGIVGIKYLF